MYTERLQLLLSPEQRRRLEEEAKRLRTSIASIIRDAVEEKIGRISPDRRIEAFHRLHGRSVPFLPVSKLNALIEGRHKQKS